MPEARSKYRAHEYHALARSSIWPMGKHGGIPKARALGPPRWAPSGAEEAIHAVISHTHPRQLTPTRTLQDDYRKGIVFYLMSGSRIIVHSPSRFEPISTEPRLKKMNVARVVETVCDPHRRPTRTTETIGMTQCDQVETRFTIRWVESSSTVHAVDKPSPICFASHPSF